MAEILHHFWLDGISLHPLNLNIGGIQMQETDAVMNGWNPAPPSMSSQHWNYGGCRGKHQRCYNAIHGRRCRISAINSRNGWNRWVMVYNLPVLASPPIRVTSLSARRHLLCRGHLETWESDGSTSTGNAGAMLIFGGRIWRRQIISGGHFLERMGWVRQKDVNLIIRFMKI